MTGVLREVWTEFWEGGAYRDSVRLCIMEGRQGLVYRRLRIFSCTGEVKGMPVGGKTQRQRSMAHGPYLAWVEEAIGSIGQSRLGLGHVWSSSDLRT